MKRTLQSLLFALIAMMMPITAWAQEEATAEVKWGTDVNNLTNSGTLYEALTTDPIPAYIQVQTDGASGITASGNSASPAARDVTLDLNGKSVSMTNYIRLQQKDNRMRVIDSSAEKTGKLTNSNSDNMYSEVFRLWYTASLTIESGTIEAQLAAFLIEENASVTLNGGTISSTSYFVMTINGAGASLIWNGGTANHPAKSSGIYFQNGLIDLSGHPDPSGIGFYYTGTDGTAITDANLKLPAGYVLTYKDNVVSTLKKLKEHYVKATQKYTVTIATMEHGTIAAVKGEKERGEQITLSVTPERGYQLGTITVTDAEGNAVTVTDNQFTMPASNVAIAATFRQPVLWGSSSTELTNAGTMDQALAANAQYIKLQMDVSVENRVTTGGTTTVDLNGYTWTVDKDVWPYNKEIIIRDESDGQSGKLVPQDNNLNLYTSGVLIWESGEMDAGKWDGVSVEANVSGAQNSKFTMKGGTLKAEVYAIYANGKVYVKGGTLEGGAADIGYKGGTVDLSEMENPTGITFYNTTESEISLEDNEDIVLPAGYDFYAEGAEEPATILAAKTLYTIIQTCDHSGHTGDITDLGNGKHGFICSVCGDEVSEEHSFDEYGFCTVCGHIDTEGGITIRDGRHTAFTVAEEIAVASITYVRTLPNTEWNALYVPFEIPVSEALLQDYEVAYANNMHAYDTADNGEIDELEMEVIKIKQGTLHANHPYFIRAKREAAQALRLTVEDAVLYATESVAMTCQSFYTTFTLTGIYDRMEAADFAALEGTHYAIAREGGWWQTEGLNPLRVYLTILEREGSPVKVSAEAMARVRIVTRGESEGETTGIDNSEFSILNSSTTCRAAAWHSPRRVSIS